MAYTTIDDPTIYFNTKLYTGTGSSLAITGVGFQPDWVWIKKRNGTTSHTVTDSVRGVNKQLFTNETAAEESYTSVLTAFDSDGFSLSTAGLINASSDTYASWNWKTGTSFTNDASATGIGSIDSTGSVNTDAGFSICSYTGTGSTGTIKHGLNTAPAMIIVKNRSAEQNWVVYHQSLGNTKAIFLSTNGAASTGSDWFNDTSPTSTVFSVGTYDAIAGNGHNLIAYCFAEKQGYSKFGSYTGNGNADGTFVYTGFKPAFILTKRSSGAAQWQIMDNKRSPINPAITVLFPDSNDADTTTYTTDFTAQGFKHRTTTVSRNGSGSTYIYMAFAENPFTTSTGVPATAR
jgi:hypothetical protein